jgi:predicted aminopeptidase
MPANRLPILILALLPWLGGCATLGYYAQAINGQMEILRRAQPIETVIGDPRADPHLKEKLAAARRIREFASRELGLPENGSYRRYADLGRPFVAWNVFAAPEFSTRPRKWCYPFAGCVNYRGYFSRAEAERAAEGLRAEGYDVFVAGVPAYSTLGWFDDPVLSTFIHYPEPRLAALLFHELAHQLIYVPGDSTFNESFATAVEQEGMRRWLEREGSREQKAAFAAAGKNPTGLAALVEKYRDRLEALYGLPLGAERKREEKARILGELREEHAALAIGPAPWKAGELNNAALASIAVYTQLTPAFRALLERHAGDLQRFYQTVREIGGLPKEQRIARLRELSGAGHRGILGTSKNRHERAEGKEPRSESPRHINRKATGERGSDTAIRSRIRFFEVPSCRSG